MEGLFAQQQAEWERRDATLCVILVESSTVLRSMWHRYYDYHQTQYRAHANGWARCLVTRVLRERLWGILSFYVDQTHDLDSIKRDVEALVESNYISSWSHLCSNLALLLLRLSLHDDVGVEHADAGITACTERTLRCRAEARKLSRTAQVQLLRRQDSDGISVGEVPATPHSATNSSSPRCSNAQAPREVRKRERDGGGARMMQVGLSPLPDEIQREVLLMLTPRELLSAQCTCLRWRAIIDGCPLLQRRLNDSCQVTQVYRYYMAEEWGEACLNLLRLPSA